MTEARLAHVMIFVKQIEPMAAFYQTVFDLSPQPSSEPRWLVLTSKTGAGIALHALPDDIAAELAMTNPPEWNDKAASKICFEVPDVIAHRERILTHGGQAKEPWDWDDTRFCECADPEGNVIQIFMRVQQFLPELS